MRWTPGFLQPNYKYNGWEHRWFAWYPVFCAENGIYVWLETVYRRWAHTTWYYEDDHWEYHL